jgi:multiple sugar transport system permease protein
MSRWLSLVGRYLVLAVAFWFFMFPIAWIVVTSIKGSDEYLHHPPIWIPHHPSLLAYKEVLAGPGVQVIMNSAIVATATTVLNLLIGIPAAYSLSRWRTGGNFLPMWILSQRMMPPIALIVPVFLLFRQLHWIDTYQGLVAVYLVFNLPFTVWLMRGFIREIPADIDESAYVDGAGPLQVLWRITVPLSTGGVIATAIFCFIFSWTEFLFALVLSRVQVVTLPVYMTALFGTMFTFWGSIGALSTLASLPMFVLTLAAQRYLVRGLTLGALK